MKKIVISQPMYFPWRGIFEQIKNADVFIHYDDVQLPQGRSFCSRVQIKTPDDFEWLTIPLDRKHKGNLLINETNVCTTDWRELHQQKFHLNYAKAPYVQEAEKILGAVLASPSNSLEEIAIQSIEQSAKYLGFSIPFYRASKLNIPGKSTQRLVDITRHFEGDVYITGHGAKNYLEYDLFGRHNIDVQFMNYNKTPYPQLWGAFNPFVSILDLIANTGGKALDYIDSDSIPFQKFLSIS